MFTAIEHLYLFLVRPAMRTIPHVVGEHRIANRTEPVSALIELKERLPRKPGAALPAYIVIGTGNAAAASAHLQPLHSFRAEAIQLGGISNAL